MKARRPDNLPSATDELLAAGQRRVGEGSRLNLRALKPAGIDDDETERHVAEITHSYGAHAQIPPGSALVASLQPELPAPEPPRARTRHASFRLDLPEYLDQELTMRAARQRATKVYLIIEALSQAGYIVKPEDLVPDRRKTRFQPG